MNPDQPTIESIYAQAQEAQKALDKIYAEKGLTYDVATKTAKPIKSLAGAKPITPESLTPVQAYNLPTLPNSTQASMALSTSLGVGQPPAEETPLTTKEQIQQQILDIIGKQGEQGDVTASVYNKAGITEKQKLAQDLTNEYDKKQQSYNKLIEETGKNTEGMSARGVSAKIAALERQKNSELADIAIQQKAAVGDYTAALDIADKKIAAQFEPLDNQIKSLQVLYSFLQDDLSESEKMQAQANIQQKQFDYEFAKEKELYAYKAAIDAQSIGDGYNLSSKQQTLLNGVINNYSKDSTVQQAQQAQQIFNIAAQLKANPDTPGNQLIALYTLVKNLDPDSAVREGELQLATMTNSYLGKFQDSLARISEGRVLNPNAVKELATATENLAQEWVKSGQRRQTQYMSQANVFGLSDPFSTYLSGFQNPNMITGAENNQQTDNIEQDFDIITGNQPAKSSSWIVNFWNNLFK